MKKKVVKAGRPKARGKRAARDLSVRKAGATKGGSATLLPAVQKASITSITDGTSNTVFGR